MTLKDDDIVTTRVQTSRSFLARSGVVVGVALALVTGSPSVQARDAQDFIPADNKAGTTRNTDKRSGDSVSKSEISKKRDAQDFIPADNKAGKTHNTDKRSGDSVGR